VLKEQYLAGMPISEFPDDDLLSLAVSFHSEDPPDEVLQAVTAYIDEAQGNGDPIQEIEVRYRKHLLDTALVRVRGYLDT
jgi:hypothetical protein